MALPTAGIVNQGLQITGGRTFNTSDNFAAVQSISLDGNTTQGFSATDTSVSSSRTVSTGQFYAQNFDATPTRNAQTISMTTTIAAANANFTIGGIALHNATATNVTTTSNTLFAGLAEQSIAKTSNFSLQITITVTYSDSTMPATGTGTGVVNQGLQFAGGITFNTADNFTVIQSMCFDSTNTGFLATDTSISSSRGAPTNFYAQNFDATPTRNAQTITVTTTLAATSANFTIYGISLHNATYSSVSAISSTLFAGLLLSGGINHAASNNFTLAVTVTLTYNDNS